MKKILIFILALIFLIKLVSAAEVCVVVDYKDSEKKPDGKCITLEEGKNGYELLNRIGWNLLWSPETVYGHMLCKLNDVGTDLSGQYCEYKGEFWNLVLNRNGEWIHLPVGFDGGDKCWNYNINSWDGHYCTKEGDVLGFAFGPAGSEPDMFKVNISRIYVDGEKQKKVSGGGKVKDIPPDSNLRLKIELENLYDSSTEIDVNDISIEAIIEEIDNGEDIEIEIEDFDLEADKKTTKELEFKIPLEVEAKDRLLRIEINVEDDAGIKYEKEFRYDLEIEKEEHNLEIIKAKLNKDSYKCGENALLSFSIINIGAKDENVNLRIVNEDLKVDINENFELSNDAFKASSKYENGFNIWLLRNITKKTYPILIEANYGTKKERTDVNLVVSECEKKEVTKKTEEIKESEEFIEVQAEQETQEEEIEVGKEKKPKEIIVTEEKIDKNLLIVFTAVLGILAVIVIVLFVMFWVVKR